MSNEVSRASVRGEPACTFCGEVLQPHDCIASIRLLSRAHGERHFGAHVQCFQRAVRPEVGPVIDLTDVPPGLDHFLTLRA